MFSVVYSSEYSAHNRSYVSQCKYSNPRWNEKHKHVLDIGAFGKWWALQYHMTDYDLDFYPDFKSKAEEWWYLVRRVCFGEGYFTGLKSQPLVLSYFVDCEEIAQSVELKD